MSNAVRRSRAEQVELNRTEVLDAARRVFSERGYLAATLDQIAEAAGFSKGVVYSQFGSKADLFLAVLEARIHERAAAHERLLAEASATSFPAFADLATAVGRRDPGWNLALIEFRVVAARDPDLQQRYSALHDVTIDRLTEVLTVLFDRHGVTASVPMRHLARAVLALAAGDMLESRARSAEDETAPSTLLLRLVLGADAPVTDPAIRRAT